MNEDMLLSFTIIGLTAAHINALEWIKKHEELAEEWKKENGISIDETINKYKEALGELFTGGKNESK